tara:strand:+ start:1476 stop:2162 length:687 start_codon:yes stop_codon:yes gene_type:complete
MSYEPKIKKGNNDVFRFERKWLFTTSYLDLLSKSFKSNFNFKIQYPKRFVNSLYFDDHNFSSVKQNLDGVTNKSKIRLRWYGNNNLLISKAKLEVKIKKNFLNHKVIYIMDDLNNKNLKKTNDVKLITKKVNEIVKKKMLIPTATTHYERIYLISLNKKVRATIDYNLKGTNFNQFNYNPVLKKFNRSILELKYGKNYDEYVRNNCKSISSRYSKNSKYVYFVMNCYK